MMKERTYVFFTDYGRYYINALTINEAKAKLYIEEGIFDDEIDDWTYEVNLIS